MRTPAASSLRCGCPAPRSRRSSADTIDAAGAYVLLPIGIVLAIWSEWVAYGPGHPPVWLPDLLAGMTILGSGLVAWARRSASRVGLLLALTAGCWFAGNLARPLVTAAWPTPSSLPFSLSPPRLPSGAARTCSMGFPSGRLPTPVERIGVGVAYASVVAVGVVVRVRGVGHRGGRGV